VGELEAEVKDLREELSYQKSMAAKALASYQQRALQMEIIRQQNEDLDRLAQDLGRAKQEVEKRAREVEEAARLKSEFLANFSHEIRTPLNGIIGYCDLLQREEGERLTLHGRRDLSTIRANAKTLLALINDILDLSKIESGHMDVVKEQVDMQSLAQECTATVQDYLKNKDVELRAEVDDAAKEAFTDPLKVRQLMLNLLSNAAKFTELGEIVLGIKAKGNTMVISVEDTGVGIPPEQVQHIFEKFRQVDGKTTRTAGGTGLGLAIVRELAVLLGGTAHVSSTVGRGSCFTIELPGAIEGEGATQTRRSSMPASKPAAATRPEDALVLIVDDDPMMQQLLRGQLEGDGFRVQLASDGHEGIRLAKELRPHVVILDIYLPKVDGWSVLSRLKSEDALENIPVVILSVEEQRARGFSLGAFEYLVKPVDPERLLDVVKSAIVPGSGEILVVDDDAETRELVTRQLKGAGFTATAVGTGEDAILRARVTPPSLMVLDLMMPGLDGFDVLTRLREDGAEFPVVVLTGKDLDETERKTLRDGFARVITKGGVGIEEVVSQAKHLVKKRRAIEGRDKPRVLYVEDVEQNRDIVRRYLATDVELSTANDGEAGFEKVKQLRPDLILMDLSLPRIDGWEVTRMVKADPRLSHIPVVALTAHSGSEEEERARAAGCCDYITKPVDRDRLLDTIWRQISAARNQGTADG
jgi:CheY-like chemotaxis protein/signal transduction histidine kinase